VIGVSSTLFSPLWVANTGTTAPMVTSRATGCSFREEFEATTAQLLALD
jgi:hypothetical protein